MESPCTFHCGNNDGVDDEVVNDDEKGKKDNDGDDDEQRMRGSDKNGSGNQCRVPATKHFLEKLPQKDKIGPRATFLAFPNLFFFPLTNHSQQSSHMSCISVYFCIMTPCYFYICVFVYLYVERRDPVKGVDYTKAGGGGGSRAL